MADARNVASLTIGGFTFMVLTGCSTADQQVANSLIFGLTGAAVQYSNAQHHRATPIKTQPAPVYNPVVTPTTGGGTYVGGGGCGGGCTGSCGIR